MIYNNINRQEYHCRSIVLRTSNSSWPFTFLLFLRTVRCELIYNLGRHSIDNSETIWALRLPSNDYGPLDNFSSPSSSFFLLSDPHACSHLSLALSPFLRKFPNTPPKKSEKRKFNRLRCISNISDQVFCFGLHTKLEALYFETPLGWMMSPLLCA